MEWVFAGAFLGFVTIFLLHPEVFLKKTANLKKVHEMVFVRAGLGVAVLFIAIVLFIMFAIHFITELKWLLLLLLSLVLMMIGTVSASKLLFQYIRHEQTRMILSALVEFYESFKSVFTPRYLGYILITFFIVVMLISMLMDFNV